MHDSERTREIKQLINTGEYEAAQSQIDAILHVDPDDAQAKALQRDIIWQLRREDEQKPVVMQGGMAQFAGFVIGAGMVLQPFFFICIALYRVLILHHFGPITIGGSRAGSSGPMSTVSPAALVFGSLVDLCLGVWIMRACYISWRNS